MSDASLLPWNATAQERALAEAMARLTDVPVLVREQWNPDTCPASVLPWLAWAMSVDEWDAGWTEAQKREAVKASFVVHRRKGTIGSLRAALLALGFELQIVEWFQETPVGAPYTFRIAVTVDQVGASQGQLMAALSVVESAKNLRSHLTSVGVEIASRAAAPVVGATTLSGHNITVMPDNA